MRLPFIRHSRESGDPASLHGQQKKRDPRLRGDDEDGFTLVELMVVIVILGLLATIVAINVIPSGEKAKVIKARLAGQPAPPPFHYHHEGSLAQIGKRRAVADFGWIKLKGALAWWLWGIAHIYFLIGTRTRVNVAVNWLWIHTRNHRSARLITQGMPNGERPVPVQAQEFQANESSTDLK